VTDYLQLADWRRRVSELYARMRSCADTAEGHALWRAGRDELFRTHPQSPLAPQDPLRDTGLPYWDYNPMWRFETRLLPATEEVRHAVPTGEDGTTSLLLAGRVELGEPVNAALDVWWLHQYAGGLFLPVRDATAGRGTYGGGRYLLDTAKGADLGQGDASGQPGTLIIDLNFLYHPSCRYDPRWVCPLAPSGNRVGTMVQAGERLLQD
jgi:uncharacterized protein (DUF1684 family)